MKAIRLTNKGFAYVSEIDYEYLMQWNWRSTESLRNITPYAYRCAKSIDGEVQSIWMHRVVGQRIGLIIPEGYEIDHKDQDGLNNERSNLRVVTITQNRFNTGIRKDNTSGFRGVSYVKRDNKWDSGIQVNKRMYHLGRFKTFEEAIIARLEAEEKYLRW